MPENDHRRALLVLNQESYLPICADPTSLSQPGAFQAMDSGGKGRVNMNLTQVKPHPLIPHLILFLITSFILLIFLS